MSGNNSTNQELMLPGTTHPELSGVSHEFNDEQTRRENRVTCGILFSMTTPYPWRRSHYEQTKTI